jgi:hypothetical protein
MKIYYAETDRGCALRTAETLDKARAQFKREVGEDNVRTVREATEKDIDWVRGMGGYVPPFVKLE